MVKTETENKNVAYSEENGSEAEFDKTLEGGGSDSEIGNTNKGDAEAVNNGVFAEPDKREIFENKISGKDLTIVQQHIEETAKRLDPDIRIKWDPELDRDGIFNPYT